MDLQDEAMCRFQVDVVVVLYQRLELHTRPVWAVPRLSGGIHRLSDLISGDQDVEVAEASFDRLIIQGDSKSGSL